MATFIDPFTDTGFKIIFGEKNKDSGILKEFLNDLFEGQPYFEHIVEVEYLNNERTKNSDFGKTIIYDVYCTTQSGHRFIVEMQRQSQINFINRAVYYVSRALVDQASINEASLRRQWNYKLYPVVGVFFCDFHVKGLQDKLVHHIRLCDSDTGQPVSNLMCYTFIQLPLFKKSKEECVTEFDKWIYTLKNMPTMTMLPFNHRDVFERLAKVSNESALNPRDRAAYEKDIKWALDYYATIETAKIEGRAAGMAEGRAEGMAEGRAEGRAAGMAEGRAAGRAEGMAEGERQKAFDIAKNLLALGLSLEQIMGATGLSQEDISRI